MMLWLLVSCSCRKPAESEVAGDCSALSSSLQRLHAGEDVAGIDVDDKRRVQVVVKGDFDKPKGSASGFDEELRAGGLAQGWIPVSQLCALADTPGVTEVRVPDRASPK